MQLTIFQTYDQFTTIDETPNPLAHGQFLGNFGGVLPDAVIWRLAEGDRLPLQPLRQTLLRN